MISYSETKALNLTDKVKKKYIYIHLGRFQLKASNCVSASQWSSCDSFFLSRLHLVHNKIHVGHLQYRNQFLRNSGLGVPNDPTNTTVSSIFRTR